MPIDYLSGILPNLTKTTTTAAAAEATTTTTTTTTKVTTTTTKRRRSFGHARLAPWQVTRCHGGEQVSPLKHRPAEQVLKRILHIYWRHIKASINCPRRQGPLADNQNKNVAKAGPIKRHRRPNRTQGRSYPSKANFTADLTGFNLSWFNPARHQVMIDSGRLEANLAILTQRGSDPS